MRPLIDRVLAWWTTTRVVGAMFLFMLACVCAILALTVVVMALAIACGVQRC